MAEKKPDLESDAQTKDQVVEVRGSLQIKVTRVETDEVVKSVELQNLVVDNFRTQSLHALAGNDYANREIDRIQLGTSGVAEAVADVAITGPVDVAVTPTFPASKQVQFTGTLGAGDGNGNTFQEAGLVFLGVAPNLAARRTFAGMAKTAAFSWALTWTLTWS